MFDKEFLLSVTLLLAVLCVNDDVQFTVQEKMGRIHAFLNSSFSISPDPPLAHRFFMLMLLQNTTTTRLDNTT